MKRDFRRSLAAVVAHPLKARRRQAKAPAPDSGEPQTVLAIFRGRGGRGQGREAD
jgi:hypothetical protein